jgi:hypothetical protein
LRVASIVIGISDREAYMYSYTRFLTAAAIVASAACASTAGQSTDDGASFAPAPAGSVTVSGRVTARDGTPVANARVYVPGTGAATRTDANGSFALAGVPAGPQSVVVRHNGYAVVRTDVKFSTKPSDRERNHIDVVLPTESEATADATQRERDLAGLQKVGFLQRQSTMNGAYFLGPDDIAGRKPNRVSDIFRTVPVVFEAPGPYGPVLRGAQGCLITYVDGLPWRSMFPGDLDADIPVRDVVAAEVYPPGQTPPAPFSRASLRRNCTTIGIWTRAATG